MTPRSECAAVADLLPELALGTIGGTERADVLAHLDHCAACREKTSSFAAIVDVLPTLVPEVEPPSGFEARTLDRLRAERPRTRRRSTRWWTTAIAALVALVMIATIATVRIIDARSSTSSADAVVVRTAPMIGDGTHRVGRALLTASDERYLWLDIDYGAGDFRYRVEAVDAAHRATDLGTVRLRRGTGSWVREIHGAPPSMVRLVAVGGPHDGKVFCLARFAAPV
jgi:Putative zinc-finger